MHINTDWYVSILLLVKFSFFVGNLLSFVGNLLSDTISIMIGLHSSAIAGKGKGKKRKLRLTLTFPGFKAAMILGTKTNAFT